MIIKRNDFNIINHKLLFKITEPDNRRSGMENSKLPNTDERGGTKYPGEFTDEITQRVKKATIRSYKTPDYLLSPDGRSINLNAV